MRFMRLLKYSRTRLVVPVTSGPMNYLAPTSVTGFSPGQRITHSICSASLLAFLAALVLAGCSSSKPAGASFASVVISGHTAGEIEAVAEAVFRENGYQGAALPGTQMIFEKQASRTDQFAYSGLMDESPVKVRVLAEVVTLTDTSHRLQCTAYMVRNPGDSLFEEKQRLANFRRGPYQKLLDKVAAELKPPVTPPAVP